MPETSCNWITSPLADMILYLRDGYTPTTRQVNFVVWANFSFHYISRREHLTLVNYSSLLYLKHYKTKDRWADFKNNIFHEMEFRLENRSSNSEHTHTHTHTHTNTFTHMHAHTHTTHTHTRTCMHACIHSCIHARTRARTHMFHMLHYMLIY